ncbi:MAG TPA: DUF6152 family protein [Vicinamibacterales bacterium]|nr:DUF6152 family protein [Vicinamibacterales bacterium]
MSVKRIVVIAAVGLTMAMPAMAHHSFAAEYDANKPVVLTGVVTRIEWTNPHAHCYLDVTDGAANVTHWCVELAGPHALAECGWRASTVHVGDQLTVHGAAAKDGTSKANARLVTLADGRVLSAGSSGGDTPSPHH